MLNISIVVCEDCPLYNSDESGSWCGHPSLRYPKSYDESSLSYPEYKIIPEKCPLRKESILIRLSQSEK